MTSSEKTLKFAKKYGSQIASAINNSNIFFETAIAQACLESGYGTSPIAVCCNNFKGIAGRPIYSSGKNGKWAIFPTPLDCFKSYATFINNLKSDKVINGKRVQVLRYEKALNAKTPQDQIYQLVYAGYCTSPKGLSADERGKHYLNKCKGNVETLQKYKIAGKIGLGGIPLSDFQSSITNLII